MEFDVEKFVVLLQLFFLTNADANANFRSLGLVACVHTANEN